MWADLHFLAVDGEFAVFLADFALKATVHGVVLEHVLHVIGVDERIVDADDLNVVAKRSCAENHAADAAKTVDTYRKGHEKNSKWLSVVVL